MLPHGWTVGACSWPSFPKSTSQSGRLASISPRLGEPGADLKAATHTTPSRDTLRVDYEYKLTTHCQPLTCYGRRRTRKQIGYSLALSASSLI